MALLPEGVGPYPRWKGRLGSGAQWPVVAAQQVREAFQGRWTLAALLVGVGWGVASIIEIVNFAQDRTEHDIAWYISMLDQLRWFALLVAGAVGAPALLEDARRGALELYFTRSLTPRGYLLAKSLAVFALTTGVMLVPAIIYYGAVYAIYDAHPHGWGLALAGAAAYSVLWGLMVSGLALGLSAAARSARAAVLILFGVFAGLDVFVGRLLGGLTGDARLQVLSPFSAIEQTQVWLFGIGAPFAFPAWWGLVAVAVLAAIGWSLLAWKRPRVKGVEP